MDLTVGGAADAATVHATTDRLLADLSMRTIEPVHVVGTGFDPLDSVLDGGFRPEELVIVGGKPGVGKTIALLQFARAAAETCHPVAVVSYEHSEQAMLRRLLSAEIARLAGDHLDLPAMIMLRRAVRDHIEGRLDTAGLMALDPAVSEAFDRLRSDGPFLSLQRALPNEPGLPALEAVVVDQLGPGGVLVIDYLQKVPLPSAGNALPEIANADMAARLKDLALTYGVVVIAASAASDEAIGDRRLRLWGLRGSASLAHEADVALLLNEKIDVVSRRHGAHDLTLLDGQARRIVFTIEKYRDGPAPVHLEFEKQFADFRFNPRGGFVTEHIIGDGLTAE